MLELNKTYFGDALSVLKTFPAESVDCVMTSPPYWGLRQYLPNAVRIRLNLSQEERSYVEQELLKAGIYGK